MANFYRNMAMEKSNKYQKKILAIENTFCYRVSLLFSSAEVLVQIH
jgi:hypothetical protein